jgi:hypothetical protein
MEQKKISKIQNGRNLFISIRPVIINFIEKIR